MALDRTRTDFRQNAQAKLFPKTKPSGMYGTVVIISPVLLAWGIRRLFYIIIKGFQIASIIV